MDVFISSRAGWIWRYSRWLSWLPMRHGGFADGADLRRPNGSMPMQTGRWRTRMQSMSGTPLWFLHQRLSRYVVTYFFFQHNSSFVRESSFVIRAHPVLLRSSLPTGGMMTSCQTLIENKQTNKEAERKRVFKWRRAHTSAYLLKPFEPWKRTFLKLSSTFDLSVKMLSKAHAKHCVSNVFFCVLLFSALWKVVDIWCRHEGHVFFQRD